MTAKPGVPDDSYSNGGGLLNESVLANTGVGESAGKQRAGVPKDEECSDDDDGADDIPLPMQSTSCARNPTSASQETSRRYRA